MLTLCLRVLAMLTKCRVVCCVLYYYYYYYYYYGYCYNYY